MRNDKYEYGLERDIFTDMELEEMLILATIGYHHIKEKAEDLRAVEQRRIAGGFERINGKDPNKEQIKDANHMVIQHCTRRNAECKAKETMMAYYGKYKDISFNKMIKKLQEENKEKKENRK